MTNEYPKFILNTPRGKRFDTKGFVNNDDCTNTFTYMRDGRQYTEVVVGVQWVEKEPAWVSF